MYFIIFIIFTILTMEIYLITSNYLPKDNSNVYRKKNKTISISQDKQDSNLLNEYHVKTDKKIAHTPGKIMIDKDYNIFVNTEKYNKLIEKNTIYNIDVPFELEIVNLSEKNIKYYYISYD